MRGNEVAHAPHLAVTATPWPGSVQVWSSAEPEGGFALNLTLPRRAIMGVTVSPMAAARAGVWDRGPALRVRLKGGQLRAATDAALLAGANVMAIGDGTPDRWELFQFARAELVAPGLWEIGMRLRGQAGTDALMPEVWPAGSIVVMIDGAPRQVDLPPDARGMVRHWRIGPASRAPDDPSYRERTHAFAGAGLRPLSPCHLSVVGRQVGWTRRTRVGGDGWEGWDVPLGEAAERYVVRLMRGATRLYEWTVAEPRHEIPQQTWDSVRAEGAFTIEVAQLSDVYGPGPFVRRTIDG